MVTMIAEMLRKPICAWEHLWGVCVKRLEAAASRLFVCVDVQCNIINVHTYWYLPPFSPPQQKHTQTSALPSSSSFAETFNKLSVCVYLLLPSVCMCVCISKRWVFVCGWMCRGLRWLTVLLLIQTRWCFYPLSLFFFAFIPSLPLDSSSEFPSEEQVIAHPPPPSPPTSPLSLPFLLRSGPLSLSLPLRNVPLRPDRLPPAHRFSLLLCCSVAARKERRVDTGKAGGRSQSRGGYSSSSPSISSSGSGGQLSDWKRYRQNCLMRLSSFYQPLFLTGSYSTAVPPQLAIFVSYFLCSWHAWFQCHNASVALSLPPFPHPLPALVSLSVKAAHGAVHLLRVILCCLYQISHNALMLFLIVLPLFTNPIFCFCDETVFNQT